jgi:hypothetical protein
MPIQSSAARGHAHERPTRTFRTVADFLAVPPTEIGACLSVFQAWLLRAHELRASAQREGHDASSLDLGAFTWHARAEPSAERPTVPYPATTPIGELGLRPSAMWKLRELNLYALEDFTLASEDELLRMPDVGQATVAQIRSYLHAIGLDFRPPQNPWRRADQRARIAWRLPPAERHVDDTSEICDLGLRPQVAWKCMQKGITTVGALRTTALRDLWIAFGKKTVLEVVETLEAVGMELACEPTQLEKWRHDAIRPERLVPPPDHASVLELQPWLGSACEHLKRDGVDTVADARRLALAGGRKIRGMGAHSWERVLKHFGASGRGAG